MIWSSGNKLDGNRWSITVIWLRHTKVTAHDQICIVRRSLTGDGTREPVVAQQVISEPGYCAFIYPNANCQNKGPGNPYTDGGYYRNTNWQNGNASLGHRRHHHHHHRMLRHMH
jgi:hypothetical protein